MKMSNQWNRIIYRIWAPFYDATVGRFFLPGRKRAMAALALQPGESLLLVGCGTGADLPFIPGGVEVTGIDLSQEMLNRAQARLPLPGRMVTLLQGDAQRLLVQEATYDAVVFNLILSVIPNGRLCLQENLGALKPGGRAVIFDKFLPYGAQVSLGRRVMNFFSTVLGTDITRRFGDVASGLPCQVTCNEPSLMRGMYRIILLKKTV